MNHILNIHTYSPFTITDKYQTSLNVRDYMWNKKTGHRTFCDYLTKQMTNFDHNRRMAIIVLLFSLSETRPGGKPVWTNSDTNEIHFHAY